MSIRNYKDLSPIQKLIAMIVEDRREFFAILLYSLIHSLLFLAVPLAAQALVNVVISGLYLQPLIVLTFALLLGLLVAGLLTLIRFYLVEVMRERIFARVALRVSERLPRVCHRSLAEKNGPELMNRFFDVVNIQKSWFKLAYEGPGALLEILVGVLLLGLYGTELLGIATGLVVFGTLLIVLAGFRGLQTSLAESAQKYRVAEWLEDMTRCQDAMKLNSRPDYWAEEADNRVVDFLRRRRQHFWVLVRQKTVYYTLSAFALSGMLGMGGYLVIQGELTLGQLVAAELVIWGILKASQKLIGLAESFYDLLTGLEKVSVITAMETDKPGTAEIPTKSAGAEVSLEGVHFTYKLGHPPVFQDLSLQIAPGSLVSIVGEAGSGKSTLISFLAGFLKPQRGSVEIDEIDLRECDPKSLAQNVSIHSGHADLFAGSLIDNVAVGRNLGLHQVKELLEASGSRDLLGKLPQGAQSMLSSSGRALSGSEKQSLLLCRSLVAEPRLLLLDESLYTLSERQQAIFAKSLESLKDNCTIISTLPFPELVAKSDVIFYLKNGGVAETHTLAEKATFEGSQFQESFPHLSATVSRILSERRSTS